MPMLIPRESQRWRYVFGDEAGLHGVFICGSAHVGGIDGIYGYHFDVSSYPPDVGYSLKAFRLMLKRMSE